jgi:MFS family permease
MEKPFLLIALVYLLVAMALSLPAPFFPTKAKKERGMSSFFIGFIIRYIALLTSSLYSIAMMSFSPLVGKYMYNLGRKRVLLFGIALTVSDIFNNTS